MLAGQERKHFYKNGNKKSEMAMFSPGYRTYDYQKGKIISEMEIEFSALDNKSTASEYPLDLRKYKIYTFRFRLHGMSFLGYTA